MRCNSLPLRKLGALLYLFTTETGGISLVYLKPALYEEFCVTEIWLPCICDDQMDLIVYACPITRTLRRLL